MTVPSPAAIHHTCFVVRDLEQTARTLSTSLGVGPWNFWTIEPEVLRVRGKDARSSFRLALATVGGGTYELISPHVGRGVYNEHLDQHGEGFHHTCLVYPTLEAVRAAKTALIAEGREMIQDGGTDDLFEFAYFMFPEIGSAVEVLYLDVQKLPPPELVIP